MAIEKLVDMEKIESLELEEEDGHYVLYAYGDLRSTSKEHKIAYLRLSRIPSLNKSVIRFEFLNQD